MRIVNQYCLSDSVNDGGERSVHIFLLVTYYTSGFNGKKSGKQRREFSVVPATLEKM